MKNFIVPLFFVFSLTACDAATPVQKMHTDYWNCQNEITLIVETNIDSPLTDQIYVAQNSAQKIQMARVISASGAKYQHEKNDVIFWQKGDKAQFIQADIASECQKMQDIDFNQPIRAMGQEPPWIVTINNPDIDIMLDYATRLYKGLNEAFIQKDGAWIAEFTFDDHRGQLSVQKGLCQDSMSGRYFPAEAVLTAEEGKNLRGCAENFIKP